MPGFAPILGPAAETLILGSMPSEVSLSMGQYYAHPRNKFWWIMSQIFNFDPDLCYAKRSQFIANKSVAVWDVLFDCERPGSLDSAIVRGSERVNDFERFFLKHPELQRVIFNGAAAEKIFQRYCKALVADIGDRVTWYRCPSTSPAHASISAEAKLDTWRQAIKPSIMR